MYSEGLPSGLPSRPAQRELGTQARPPRKLALRRAIEPSKPEGPSSLAHAHAALVANSLNRCSRAGYYRIWTVSIEPCSLPRLIDAADTFAACVSKSIHAVSILKIDPSDSTLMVLSRTDECTEIRVSKTLANTRTTQPTEWA